jgi:hypothetical protein
MSSCAEHIRHTRPQGGRLKNRTPLTAEAAHPKENPLQKQQRGTSCTLPVGAAAQFGVKKVLTIPLKRRITAKLTVELSGVPFGCTACRKAVRSPRMHSPK